MKKYTLGMVVVNLLSIATIGMAMEKKVTPDKYSKKNPRKETRQRRGSKERVATNVPKVRISNKSRNSINLSIEEVDCRSDYATSLLPNGKRILKPGETIVIDYAGSDCLRFKVNDGSAENRIDWLDRIERGQVVDVIYGDNGKYFPWIFGEGGWEMRERSKKSAPHLYEVRNGRTLNHGHDKLTD